VKHRGLNAVYREPFCYDLSDYGAVWIATPKAASTLMKKCIAESIGLEVPEGTDPHCANWGTRRIRIGRAARTRGFKFGFVRNPWDRFVSCWADRVRRGFYEEWYGTPEPDTTFVEFVRLATKKNPYTVDGHFRMQSAFLKTKRGAWVPDEVFRFERLHEDWATHIAPRFGWNELPSQKLNKSDRPPYREMYTPYTRDAIADFYREDIERFGYEF